MRFLPGMIGKGLIGFGLFAGVAGVAGTVYGLDFNPGLYEITSTMEMPGMGAQFGQMQPPPMKQCLSRNDTIPEQAMAASGCTVSNQRIKGNTVSWQMRCQQQGMSSSGTGEMTYSGDSFSGQFKIEMGPQAGNMQVTTRMQGRRLGDCQK